MKIRSPRYEKRSAPGRGSQDNDSKSKIVGRRASGSEKTGEDQLAAVDDWPPVEDTSQPSEGLRRCPVYGRRPDRLRAVAQVDADGWSLDSLHLERARVRQHGRQRRPAWRVDLARAGHDRVGRPGWQAWAHLLLLLADGRWARKTGCAKGRRPRGPAASDAALRVRVARIGR